MAKKLHKHLAALAKLRKGLFYIVGFWWCLKEMDGMMTVQKWDEKSNLMINLPFSPREYTSNQNKNSFNYWPKHNQLTSNFYVSLYSEIPCFHAKSIMEDWKTKFIVVVFIPLHQNFFITMGWLLFNTSKHSFDGFITSYCWKTWNYWSNPLWQSCGFHW